MQEERERALVLDRWNSWVRVWLPDSGEVRWIELEPEAWEALEARAPGADVAPSALRG